MYKQVHRVFITLSKKIPNGVTLSPAGFLSNNFVIPAPTVSKISLNASAYNVTKRYFAVTNEDCESDSESEQLMTKFNPSVEVQKEIQKEAKEKLDSLLANDPDLLKFHKVIELEMEILRQSGAKLPDELRPTDWLELITKKTQTSRRKYLEFLWSNQIRKISQKMKRLEMTELRKNMEEEDFESNESKYGLRNNTMFTRIYKSTMSHVLNAKLMTAMMFGQKLVIDCGFESHMTFRELSSAAKQLMYSFVTNRLHRDPFDIHLCNLDPKGELKRRLKSFIPTMDDPTFPINATSQSYLELFPKERLVYLTPHTNNIMYTYNPDDIYIIGGIVDKSVSKPLSMAKAKEEGLRVAKFPLENFLDWKAGSGKTLNVNHCVEIMLDIKDTNDWNYALKVVPSRKTIRPYTEYTNNAPKVTPVFKSSTPKFQSGQAAHVPDLSYYKRKKRED